MRRQAQSLLLILIVFLICPSAGMAASEVGSSQQVIVKQSMQDQVQTLRQQRYDKMPYLDKGYVKSEISRKNLEKRQVFVSGPERKLKDLVARALDIDNSVKVARERISLARRRILVALRNLFPEANFEFNISDGVLSGSPTNSNSYRLTMTQPIFRGGILWHTFLQEKAELEASQKEYQGIIEDLVKDVSIAYFEYNRALQVVHDAKEVRDKMSRFAGISNEKHKSKLISEIEHLNVQSLFNQLQYDFETAKQELELAKLELQRFLNVQDHDPLRISPLYEVGSLVEDDITASDSALETYEEFPTQYEKDISGPKLVELVDLAYRNRAELQVEASKLESARLEEKIRWGEMIPQADITLELGKMGEAFDFVSNEPPLFKEFRLFLELRWNAAGSNIKYQFENDERGPSISQFARGTPSQTTSNTVRVGVLDGLNKIAEAKEAEVSRLDQVIALEQAEKEVVRSVKQSYYDFEKAKIQVQSTLQRVDYRARLTRLAAHRLGQNEVEISEYLENEIDLLQEKTALHRALADYFSAKAELNHAIGIRDYFDIEEKYGS
ncbi:MAG: TolC family protein [Candidatus Omnitrophica bacterium]|nr:TolC family protein [Candidatus Omnitrophota bacterium]